VASTRNNHIGVIGTSATVSSNAYEDAFAAAVDLDITAVACPKFVDFVERGITSGPELLKVAEDYLAPIRDAGVDTLVLGCTHYPLLTGAISYVMGDGVTLVSSDEETAKDVYRTLTAKDLLRTSTDAPSYRFQATGDTKSFEKLARRFLGPEVQAVESL
jgi:glutamate racemase